MKLTEFLKQNPPRGFRSEPVYFPTGDFLTYYLRDCPHVAERVDDALTVYLSHDTRELVGIKVKGVREILARARAFRVGVKDGDGVRLGLFFFASAGPSRADNLPRMKWYERLEQFAHVEVESEDLLAR